MSQVLWVPGDGSRFAKWVFTADGNYTGTLLPVGGQGVGTTTGTPAVDLSQLRNIFTLTEAGDSILGTASVEVRPGLWTSTIKPQHGLAFHVQQDGTKLRAIVVWHDTFIGIPQFINVGVWDCDLNGTNFFNRQAGLFMALGQTIVVTGFVRSGNVVTATVADSTGVKVGDFIGVDSVTNSFDIPGVASAQVTEVTPTTVRWAQTGVNESGGAGTLTRTFPYTLQARVFPRNGHMICQARAWDRQQAPTDWGDNARAIEVDLDSDEAGDAATRAAHPTPAGAGKPGLVVAHVGSNAAAKAIYGAFTVDAHTLRGLYAAIAAGPLKAVGLRAFDYVPGSSEWPGAFVLPPVIDYEGLANNVLELRVDIVVLVSATVDKNQHQLLDYMDDSGTKSIPLAFHQNRTLGLDGVDAFVVRSRPLNLEEQASYSAFGALFESSIRMT